MNEEPKNTKKEPETKTENTGTEQQQTKTEQQQTKGQAQPENEAHKLIDKILGSKNIVGYIGTGLIGGAIGFFVNDYLGKGKIEKQQRENETLNTKLDAMQKQLELLSKKQEKEKSQSDNEGETSWRSVNGFREAWQKAPSASGSRPGRYGSAYLD